MFIRVTMMGFRYFKAFSYHTAQVTAGSYSPRISDGDLLGIAATFVQRQINEACQEEGTNLRNAISPG